VGEGKIKNKGVRERGEMWKWVVGEGKIKNKGVRERGEMWKWVVGEGKIKNKGVWENCKCKVEGVVGRGGTILPTLASASKLTSINLWLWRRKINDKRVIQSATEGQKRTGRIRPMAVRKLAVRTDLIVIATRTSKWSVSSSSFCSIFSWKTEMGSLMKRWAMCRANWLSTPGTKK
jgi:hypothetical protein